MSSDNKSSVILVAVFIAVIFSMTAAPHPAYGNDLIQACVKPNGLPHLIGEDFNRQGCRGHEVLVEWRAGFETEERVTDLENRVDTLENIAATKDEVMALDDRVTALEGRVEALEKAVRHPVVIDGPRVSNSGGLLTVGSMEAWSRSW